MTRDGGDHHHHHEEEEGVHDDVWVAIMVLSIILGLCLFILFSYMCCCVTRVPATATPPAEEPLLAMVTVPVMAKSIPPTKFSVTGKKVQ